MGYQTTSKSTAAEHAEVLRLRQAGLSIRAIAAAVCDNARYRGRVERILAKAELQLEAAPAADKPSLDGLAPLEAIRILFERRSRFDP